ncbi:MAG: putative Ig domain-containing protein, partial [Nitrososphaeria archaeon]
MNDQERVPKINNPKVFGVRPDSEFILPITASGEKPFHYSALNLLKDLSINESNGTITGKITNKGRYEITLQVKNKYGKAERDIEVVVGENISLTPPMGWNHWNCWGPKIDEDKVRQAAD